MHLLTRRSFVKGGLGIAVTALPLAHLETASALGRAAAGAGAVPGLERSTFVPLLGRTVQVSDGVRATAGRLVAVRDLTPARMPNDQHCFSLLFALAPGMVWPGQIYRFSAPRLGSFALFAAPVGKSGGCLEIVVNSPA